MSVIAIQKSKKSEIRVSLGEFRGQERVDVRTFYRNDDGEFTPSRQGISLPVERVGELIDALIGLDTPSGGGHDGGSSKLWFGRSQ